MFKSLSIFTTTLLAIGLASFAQATPTSIMGTITIVGAYGNQADTYIFQLSSQPTTGCSNSNYFEVSPSTVSDAQSRKNIYATLLTAKATGAQVSVVYDTASFCDTMGFPAVYSVFLY